MPREGKGQKVNPNRTDLNTALPKQSAGSEGREYGSRKQDMQAQDEVPLRPPPDPPGPLPGDLGPLTAPTNRPDEPITDGIPSGPGRGPEASYFQPARGYTTPLQRVAEQTQNPRLLNLVRKIYG